MIECHADSCDLHPPSFKSKKTKQKTKQKQKTQNNQNLPFKQHEAMGYNAIFLNCIFYFCIFFLYFKNVSTIMPLKTLPFFS